MNTSLQLPFYAKSAFILVGLYMFVSMLSILESILLPIIFATIIAIVVVPLVNFLISKGLGRAVSSFIILLIGLLIIAGLVSLVAFQANNLGASWPQLTAKFESLFTASARMVSSQLHLSTAETDAWISRIQSDLLSAIGSRISITITNVGGFLAMAFLVPVYTFMLLYYQPHLIAFIHKLFGAGYNSQISHILTKTKSLIQRYLFGLSIQLFILAILNSIGLLVIGIDYAILLGILGALLNLIPYLGGLIGVSLFAIIALVTKTPVYVLYVFALYSIIQVIDNNFIVPKIVGGKVRLNALVSIISVIAGAVLWGIPGMFLFIPLVAILKLILDNIDSLKHWGTLLGEPAKASALLKGSE